MAAEGQWEILEDLHSAGPDLREPEEFAYPVHHSFGRGTYKSRALSSVVPKAVLDRIIGKGCWTDQPRGSTSAAAAGGRRRHPKMGGVKGADPRPKTSGRARALHVRMVNTVQRRPGHQVSMRRVCLFVCDGRGWGGALLVD